jgi:hypothetical protein
MKLPLIVFTVAFGLMPAGIASAKPSFAINNDNSCSVCHTRIVSGRMDVIGADEMVDLGTQLDGSERGPLSTFWVVPGESVTLSMEVLDGSSSGCSACSKFAVQLKRLEKSGQEIDLSNFLIWAEDNLPGNPWTRQEVTNPPYFTKDDGNDGGLPSQDAGPFSFDLFVDAATPPDFYDLEFAVAGKGGGLWYEDQHFYVQVVPEPSATLLGIVAVSAIAAVRRIGGRPPGLIG